MKTIKLIDAERKFHFAPYTTDSEDFKIELTAEEILNTYTDEGCPKADAPSRDDAEWIPCGERLPENDYVLISKKPTMISGDKWSVAIAIRMADPRSGKIQWRDSGFGVIQDDKVLAWMPLPTPYRGGGDENG